MEESNVNVAGSHSFWKKKRFFFFFFRKETFIFPLKCLFPTLFPLIFTQYPFPLFVCFDFVDKLPRWFDGTAKLLLKKLLNAKRRPKSFDGLLLYHLKTPWNYMHDINNRTLYRSVTSD